MYLLPETAMRILQETVLRGTINHQFHQGGETPEEQLRKSQKEEERHGLKNLF